MWWYWDRVFRRWSMSWGDPLEGTSVAMKEAPQRSFSPSTRMKSAFCHAEEDLPAKLNHADTLISDFEPLELWKINFYSLEATQSVVIHYSSLNGLRQPKCHVIGYTKCGISIQWNVIRSWKGVKYFGACCNWMNFLKICEMESVTNG